MKFRLNCPLGILCFTNMKKHCEFLLLDYGSAFGKVERMLKEQKAKLMKLKSLQKVFLILG